jgi:WD40 repeat protein
VADASIAQTFKGHTNRVNTVEFSPDGAHIASTSWDSTVRLWDVASGQQIREYVGHNSETFGIAFSPDGKSLLSGSSDATVRLWDLESGDELLRLTGHTSWIQSVKFHPSGDFAISGAQDNTLKVWRTARDPEKVLQFARENRYMRDLTCAEYLRYRIAPPESCAAETAASGQS